jgi:hypothetical protein
VWHNAEGKLVVVVLGTPLVVEVGVAAIALWRLETVMDDEAALASLSNKLVVLLDAGFSLRSKRRGGEQRLLRSRGAIYGNSRSFSCRSSQSVARCTAAILGPGGHSACQGLVLLARSLLPPYGRIFWMTGSRFQRKL